MNDVKIPGFTADASLYATSRQYMMTEAPVQAGAIQPQIPMGEWQARADSVAAFYYGGGHTSHTLTDIAERKTCLRLSQSCRRGNMEACRLMWDECGRR